MQRRCVLSLWLRGAAIFFVCYVLLVPTQLGLAEACGLQQAVARDRAGPSTTAGRTFLCPAIGRIVYRCWTRDPDQISIATHPGAVVRAVAAGTVLYSGDELKGYGNMIVIRHAQGFTSLYARVGDAKVKRGDQVVRGQIVAVMLQNEDDFGRPFAFQLERRGKVVDPNDYMACR